MGDIPIREQQTEPKKTVRFRNPFAAPDHDEPPQCGLFGWTPAWLQLFGNMKVFMFCYVGMGIFEGMYGSYAGTVLPSLERRFGVSGTQMGSIRSAKDISQILAALVVGHYGGSGHRPRWMAAGTVMQGLGMLLYAAPEFLFPLAAISTSSANPTEEVCHTGNSSLMSNFSGATCAPTQHSSGNTNPIIVFAVSDFLMGLGGTMPLILGLPYVDDNVSYKMTPIYFALSHAGRIVGQPVGLGMGAVINSVYYDLTDPPFNNKDLRWISAWYLGYIICGVGVCIFAVLVGCFPAAMPRKIKNVEHASSEPLKKFNPATHNQHGKPRQKPVSLTDLPKNLLRILKNKIFMVKLVGLVVEMISLVGYGGFAQQFIQNQFPGISLATANLLGGMPPIFAGCLGIIIGSALIKRFNFKPRHVSMMSTVSSLVGMACYLSVLGMGCETPVVVGLPIITDGHTPAVNRSDPGACDIINNCNCHSIKFSPVCDIQTNVTYISACHAGCRSYRTVNRTNLYYDCMCIATPNHTIPGFTKPSMTVSPVVTGLCPTGCTFNMFLAYVGVMCLTRLVSSIPTAGHTMVQFRVVDVDLKSLASAMSSVVISLFALLPAPIIAGYIIDSACRFWQTVTCGGRGACLLYNVNDFRTKLHVSVGVCMLVGSCFDVVVTYLMWGLSFDRDEPPTESAAEALQMAPIGSLIKRLSHPAPGHSMSHSISTQPIIDESEQGSMSSVTNTPEVGERRVAWSQQGLQLRKSFPIDK